MMMFHHITDVKCIPDCLKIMVIGHEAPVSWFGFLHDVFVWGYLKTTAYATIIDKRE
jgi:hypothetical protein